MAKKKRSKLIDVAAAANVSKSTASRALRGDPGVSEATQRAVMTAAENLGYVRDRRAADLAGTGAPVIGMLLRSEDSPFYSAVLAAVQREVVARGAELLIVIGELTDRGPRSPLSSLLERRVDGLIIASGRATHLEVDPVARRHPLVVIGSDIQSSTADVVAIDAAAETELTGFLHKLEHRRVGIVTPPSQGISLTLEERAQKFLATATSLGMEPVTIDLDASAELPQTASLMSAINGGATAIMAGNDTQAISIIEFLKSHSVKVPDDVSVTGFDGAGIFGSAMLGLSTYRQPVEEMARHAVANLFARIESPEAEPQTVYVTGSLIAGRSAAPAQGSATRGAWELARKDSPASDAI